MNLGHNEKDISLVENVSQIFKARFIIRQTLRSIAEIDQDSVDFDHSLRTHQLRIKLLHLYNDTEIMLGIL